MLLDHGLYDYLRPDHREYLCNLYKAIIMKNEDEMEKYSHLLGVKGKLVCITKAVVKNGPGPEVDLFYISSYRKDL